MYIYELGHELPIHDIMPYCFSLKKNREKNENKRKQKKRKKKQKEKKERKS